MSNDEKGLFVKLVTSIWYAATVAMHRVPGGDAAHFKILSDTIEKSADEVIRPALERLIK
jgi:hypothetical protein